MIYWKERCAVNSRDTVNRVHSFRAFVQMRHEEHLHGINSRGWFNRILVAILTGVDSPFVRKSHP